MKCECDKIPDYRDIKECLDIVITLFSSVFESSRHFKAGLFIKGIDDEFKLFSEILLMIDQKVSILLFIIIIFSKRIQYEIKDLMNSAQLWRKCFSRLLKTNKCLVCKISLLQVFLKYTWKILEKIKKISNKITINLIHLYNFLWILS